MKSLSNTLVKSSQWECKTTTFLPCQKQLCKQQAILVPLNANELCTPCPSLLGGDEQTVNFSQIYPRNVLTCTLFRGERRNRFSDTLRFSLQWFWINSEYFRIDSELGFIPTHFPVYVLEMRWASLHRICAVRHVHIAWQCELPPGDVLL